MHHAFWTNNGCTDERSPKHVGSKSPSCWRSYRTGNLRIAPHLGLLHSGLLGRLPSFSVRLRMVVAHGCFSRLIFDWRFASNDIGQASGLCDSRFLSSHACCLFVRLAMALCMRSKRIFDPDAQRPFCLVFLTDKMVICFSQVLHLPLSWGI